MSEPQSVLEANRKKLQARLAELQSANRQGPANQ